MLERHSLLVLNDPHADADRAKLRDCISEHGLAVFEYDGIEDELWRVMYKHLDRFFNRPLAEKQKYEHPAQGRQRGYTSPRTEHARDQDASCADLKEFWQEGPGNWLELSLFPNVVTDSPEFDDIRRKAFARLNECADLVMRAIAPILQVSPDWLSWYASGGHTIARFLNYFNLEGVSFPPDTLRSAPHTDVNLITLLKTSGKGLTVRSKAGQEIELDIGPRELVVQMGDFMEVLSGGLLPATTHWVTNQPGVRKSLALFVHPDPLRRIDALPFLRPADFAWDPCTERAATEKRLIEIGILEGPPKHAQEFASKGYVFSSPWPGLM